MSDENVDRAPRQTSKPKPAPGDLRLLQAFLNTDLDGHDALADWLKHSGLMPPEAELGGSDLERAIEIRGAMRTLIARNSAAAVKAAAARLDQAMAAATIRTRFDAGGRIRFEPAAGGLDGALARLCGVLAEAQFEGTSQRLKICGASNCGVAFFDDSKNRARRWCSTRCCNRVTSSAYRSRHLESIREQERNRAYNRKYLS